MALSSLILFTVFPILAVAEVVLEEGYTVTTVMDGRKTIPAVNPYLILPRHLSGDAVVLDSAASEFYSLPLPLDSGDGEVQRFAGGGAPGFADGGPVDALFSQPRSFAVDDADNVYVADRANYAIRKISRDGVTTTIAGGYSGKTGHVDGPAQNATFSNDFGLVYVPKICALLITDRGNQLIRQMNLKSDNCADHSPSGVGAVPVTAIAILCTLFGSLLGFFARPFLVSHELSSNHYFNKTWNHYKGNLRRLILITFSGVKNVAAKCPLPDIMHMFLALSLNYVFVVVRNLRPSRTQYRYVEPVSLLDADLTNKSLPRSPPTVADQLSDLISFDNGMEGLSFNGSCRIEEETSKSGNGKIDDMMIANLLHFAEPATKQVVAKEPMARASGVVRRRASKDDQL